MMGSGVAQVEKIPYETAIVPFVIQIGTELSEQVFKITAPARTERPESEPGVPLRD